MQILEVVTCCTGSVVQRQLDVRFNISVNRCYLMLASRARGYYWTTYIFIKKKKIVLVSTYRL